MPHNQSYADQATKAFKAEMQQQSRALNTRPGADDPHRPLNQMEQQVAHSLFAIGEFMDITRNVLEKRGAHIKNSRQRIGILQWAARSLFEDLIALLDRPSAERFVRNTRTMRIRVVPAQVGQLPVQTRIISDDDLCEISEAAWRGTCMMCDRRGVDAKQCPLKKALDHTMLLTTCDGADCWYKEV